MKGVKTEVVLSDKSVAAAAATNNEQGTLHEVCFNTLFLNEAVIQSPASSSSSSPFSQAQVLDFQQLHSSPQGSPCEQEYIASYLNEEDVKSNFNVTTAPFYASNEQQHIAIVQPSAPPPSLNKLNGALLQDLEEKTSEGYQFESLHAKVLFKYMRQRSPANEDPLTLSTRFFDPVHKYKIVKGNSYTIRIYFSAASAQNWQGLEVLPPVLLDNVFRPMEQAKQRKSKQSVCEPCVEMLGSSKKESKSVQIFGKEGFVLVEYNVKFNVLSSRQGLVALSCSVKLGNNQVLTATSSQFEIVSRRKPQAKPVEGKRKRSEETLAQEPAKKICTGNDDAQQEDVNALMTPDEFNEFERILLSEHGISCVPFQFE